MTRRPRVLILARPFPPLRATSCIRTWNMAKYLARLGWDITVVTPYPSIWRNIDNPEEVEANLKTEGIQRILTDHDWRCLNPGSLHCRNDGLGWFAGGICRRFVQLLRIDRSIGWVPAAERACAALRPQDVDLILATGPPFAAFKLAKRLAKRLGCPYVLDYRDLWARNAHDPGNAFVIRKESDILQSCAAVTVVSPSWAAIMEDEFHLGAKLHVVTNGFDPEAMSHIRPHNFDHFAVVYAGNFYPPKRVITPVMAALKHLKEAQNGANNESRSEWFFHYYGSQEAHVRQEAERFRVLDKLILHGTVSQTEAFSAVGGASVAVVITSIEEQATIEEQGIIPGKLFELLGQNTPILLIAPSGSDANDILQKTRAGARFGGADIEEISQFLQTLISGKLILKNSLDYGTWSWPSLAEEMEKILRRQINTAV